MPSYHARNPGPSTSLPASSSSTTRTTQQPSPQAILARERCARILDSWELLAWYSNHFSESIPQTRLRFQREMIATTHLGWTPSTFPGNAGMPSTMSSWGPGPVVDDWEDQGPEDVTAWAAGRSGDRGGSGSSGGGVFGKGKKRDRG